jgi:hypothetical protein
VPLVPRKALGSSASRRARWRSGLGGPTPAHTLCPRHLIEATARPLAPHPRHRTRSLRSSTVEVSLARRVLIEGAWTYRMNARVSRKLHDRLEPLPAVIRDTAWKAQVRLCARYRRLVAAGKPKVVVTTAIAREMVGFIWAIARIAQPALD